MRYVFLITMLVIVLSCKEEKSEFKQSSGLPYKSIELNLEEAEKLIQLPLYCIGTEYPNKLSQTISGDEDLLPPTKLHPTFYGCFDWHSSVHGYWSIITLLKQFPEMEIKDSVMDILLNNISNENIQLELEYFNRPFEGTFERTYGWAWLLKLAEELHTWDDPRARILEENLQPLTDHIVSKYIEFLPRLHYPVRVGTHSNTAFGLSFAHDYATTIKNDSLVLMISKRSKEFYLNDKGCPLNWEPSGYDFLSPCLEELDLMRKVLSDSEFEKWIESFMPEIKNPDFAWEPGVVSDRSDGHLVHLDGVNFSRAWCLYGLSKKNGFDHLALLADKHVNFSYPNLIGDDYEGGHWLASFAIMAINTRQ